MAAAANRRRAIKLANEANRRREMELDWEDRADRLIMDAFIQTNTPTDQNYTRKPRIVRHEKKIVK